MDAAEFVRKWAAATGTERAASQEHFIDLCNLLGRPDPRTRTPTGKNYCASLLLAWLFAVTCQSAWRATVREGVGKFDGRRPSFIRAHRPPSTRTSQPLRSTWTIGSRRHPIRGCGRQVSRSCRLAVVVPSPHRGPGHHREGATRRRTLPIGYLQERTNSLACILRRCQAREWDRRSRAMEG